MSSPLASSVSFRLTSSRSKRDTSPVSHDLHHAHALPALMKSLDDLGGHFTSIPDDGSVVKKKSLSDLDISRFDVVFLVLTSVASWRYDYAT